MAYCPRCGFQNPEESAFCSKCGASLKTPVMGTEKEWDKRCENECAGGRRGASIFWGIVVILIGIGIAVWALDQGGVELPDWATESNFARVFGIVIAIALVVTGIAIIIRRTKH